MRGSIPPDSKYCQLQLTKSIYHPTIKIQTQASQIWFIFIWYVCYISCCEAENAGKWMKIKQHSKNVFKIIFGNIDLHGQHKNIILCKASSVWVHLLWLSPQWRIWFPLSPPTQCFQIASEGQASLLSSRQTGLGVQELYIAPPWRYAHTSTCTNAHAGWGMNK